MPRKRFQREFCDCRDCVDPSPSKFLSTDDARHRAALQDPPPKSIIIFGDGALVARPKTNDTAGKTSSLSPSSATQDSCQDSTTRNLTSLHVAAHPHLDGLARDGCSALLAVRMPNEGGNHRQLSHLDTLAQLFGLDAAARIDSVPPPDVASRFKEMTSSFASSSEESLAAASRAGFQGVRSLAALVAGRHGAQAAFSDLPQPATVAAAAAEALGLHDRVGGLSSTTLGLKPPAEDEEAASDENEEGVLDLLFLHIAPPVGDSISQAPEVGSSEAYDDSVARIEWIDALVRHLNKVPSSGEALLVTVIVGSHGAPLPGSLLRGANEGRPHPQGASELSAAARDIRYLRPRQSWQTAADEDITADTQAPLLMVQRLPAVIRVDSCSRFDLHECARCGGGASILAERMLHEVAYKMGRAPKYGA